MCAEWRVGGEILYTQHHFPATFPESNFDKSQYRRCLPFHIEAIGRYNLATNYQCLKLEETAGSCTGLRKICMVAKKIS
jgi:hypothetical protein